MSVGFLKGYLRIFPFPLARISVVKDRFGHLEHIASTTMTPEPLAYLLDCFGNSLVNSVFILGALYPIYLIIYRLFFSELARFPGPWYAAATAWYEFYYDIVHEGKYLFEIEKMHRQYGEHPISFQTGRTAAHVSSRVTSKME